MLSFLLLPFIDCHSDDNGSWVSGGFFSKKSISQDFTIRNNPSSTNSLVDADKQGNMGELKNERNSDKNIADDAEVDDEQYATETRRVGTNQQTSQQAVSEPRTSEPPQTQHPRIAANNLFGKTSTKVPPVDAAALEAQKDRLANNEFEERRAALSNPAMRRSISRGQAKAERLKRQYENMRPDEVERLLPRDMRRDKKEEGETAKRWSSSFLSDRQTNNSPRAKVSLIVSAEPVSELKETIAELVSLRERSRIYIGEVLIVGADKIMKSDEKKFAIASQKILTALISSLGGSDKLESPDSTTLNKITGYETLRSFLEKKGFSFSSFASSAKILNKYKVHSSPTWIVSLQHQGNRVSHVIQGRPTMGGLFTTDGAFLPVTEKRTTKAEEEDSETKKPNTAQVYQPFSLQTDRGNVVQHESPYRGTAQFATDKADHIYRYLPDIGSDDSQ